MTTILISRRGQKSKGMTLDGNRLSGDTFGMRYQIKEELNGKWDAATKSWIIDPAGLNTPSSSFAKKE